ncbi:GlmL-related ornithine degradation protein [Haloimpatiens lingqiaonensis]|uniref:GlmL-related ornithine degradation protein n=1 Tax=Haloimpatiens lingqiaonensis TaxID=1380675 RepID=UPI0010FE987D|nr:GlmL-related ornithine degradation protein [Haloimpatiens lingqiaonensis]
MKIDYLIAEIGSTTTVVSALDFNSEKILVAQGKANTTVLQGDVTLGLRNAIKEIEEFLGEKITWNKMLATSSAAGGLKITVHGLVEDMTVKAAKEAALGAGGIIKTVTAGKLYRSDIRKLKELRPNLIMIAGGTDYGERDTAIYNAEVISKENLGIPVIYCGNIANREDIKDIFSEQEIYIVDNVYPRIDELNVEPAREVIQKAFEKNIVKAPGMDRIKEMVDGTIMPTPGAVMESAKLLYESIGDVLVIDVGGATTDVHSVTEGSKEIQDILLSPEPKAKRTVEGDLGVYINSSNIIDILQEIEMQGLDAEYIRNNIEPIPSTEEQKRCSVILTQKAVDVGLQRHVGYIKRVYGAGKKFIAFGKDLSKIKYIVGTGGALTRLPGGENILKSLRYCKEDLTMYPRKEAKVLIDHMYIMACAGVLARENKECALRLVKKSINLQ